MNKAAVLMSTYNGEKYLREQIDSILAQEEVEIHLYIRDDGSKDSSLEIIHRYLSEHFNITLINGSNIGVGNSFMTILKSAGSTCDFYCFADQDDIWMPNKLRMAIKQLSASNIPQCYCSNQALVDKDGNPLGIRHKNPVHTNYMQVLCNNCMTGCTMVWNRRLQEILIEEKRFPSHDLLKKRIHDVWVAMVAATVGEVCYDNHAYIYYRQHEDNVVGVKDAIAVKEWVRKMNHAELRNGRSVLAYEIVTKFRDLIGSKKILNRLEAYANYRNSISKKVNLLHDLEICEYSGESHFMLRIKILLNLF